MQSCWHNLPRFVGADGTPYDQLPGAEYAARDVAPLEGGLTLDLAPAYGPVPGLGHYRRTATLTPAGLDLTDETDYPGEVRLTLMSREAPAVEGSTVRFGTLAEAALEGEILGIGTEAVAVTDPRLRLAWPDTLYRTVVRFTGRLRARIG